MLKVCAPDGRGFVGELSVNAIAYGEDPVSVLLVITVPLSIRFTGLVGAGSLIDHEAVNVAMHEKAVPAGSGVLAEQLKLLNTGCPSTSWNVTWLEADWPHRLSPEYWAVIVFEPKENTEDVGSNLMDALP
jgi:hypothetical protein